MVDLPKDILNHIDSYIPKDINMKSPTVDIIYPFVKMFKMLDNYHHIPFDTHHTFQDFMKDPFHYLYKYGAMSGFYSMICSRSEGIKPEWLSRDVEENEYFINVICNEDIEYVRRIYKEAINHILEN